MSITPDEAIEACLLEGAQGISLGLAKNLQAERNALRAELAAYKRAGPGDRDNPNLSWALAIAEGTWSDNRGPLEAGIIARALRAAWKAIDDMKKELELYLETYRECERLLVYTRSLVSSSIERAESAEQKLAAMTKERDEWKERGTKKGGKASGFWKPRAEVAEALVADLKKSQEEIIGSLNSQSAKLAKAVEVGDELIHLLRRGFWTQITSDIADAVARWEALRAIEDEK